MHRITLIFTILPRERRIEGTTRIGNCTTDTRLHSVFVRGLYLFILRTEISRIEKKKKKKKKKNLQNENNKYRDFFSPSIYISTVNFIVLFSSMDLTIGTEILG